MPPIFLTRFGSRNECRVAEEASVGYCGRDSNEVLHHDSACAEVEVTDLAVAHLALGKANPETRRIEKRTRGMPQIESHVGVLARAIALPSWFSRYPQPSRTMSATGRDLSAAIFARAVYECTLEACQPCNLARHNLHYQRCELQFCSVLSLAARRSLRAGRRATCRDASRPRFERLRQPVRRHSGVGQLAKGATVEVIARDRDWVRVELEGWVRESDLASRRQHAEAAQRRRHPERSRRQRRGSSCNGRSRPWHFRRRIRFAPDCRPGEQYLLALGPGQKKRSCTSRSRSRFSPCARSLPPLAQVIVTARVRNGRSEPAGVPILDLQSLTRR